MALPSPTRPCRHAFSLEAGDWAGAAALPLDPSKDAYAWQKYPQAEAINAFARGIGAARSGNAAAARVEQVRLLALRDAARAAQLALLGGPDRHPGRRGCRLGALCGGQVRCLHYRAQGGSRAGRRHRKACRHAGPIAAGARAIGRNLAGGTKPAESLAEYEAVMKKEPNRYRAIAGAMAAARAAGDDKRARALAAELVKLGAESDTPRDGLRQAKEIAGG